MKSGHVIRRLRFLLQCAVLVAFANTPAGAATNVVTTLADSGPGSLRHVISNALSGDTIMFATNGTITLTSGELVIATSLDIIGPGAANLSVSGNGASRVFNIFAGVTSSISGITIRDGRTPDGTSGGTFTNGGSGAGLYNSGAASLRDCVITANRTGNGANGTNGPGGSGTSAPGRPGGGGGAGGDGSGLFNQGILTISNCLFSGNISGNGGKGGDGGMGGPGSGTSCCFSGNGGSGGAGGRGGDGGAINNLGTAVINASTFLGNSSGNGGAGGNGGYYGFCGVTPYCGYPGGDGAGGHAGQGAGVRNEQGFLTIVGCIFSENVGGNGGVRGTNFPSFSASYGRGGSGGIGNNGLLMLSASTLSNNSAGSGGGTFGDGGGGLFNSSTAIVSSCTFSSNRAYYASYYGYGGGIASSKQLTVSNCTFSENFAANGGGIVSLGTLDISSSTFSRNLATSSGGGIYSTGLLTMVACTVASNRALNGLAGGVLQNPGNAAFVRNSLFARNQNSVVADFYESFVSGGHNSVNGGADPLIDVLADNGGPTPTHALLPGSPAIDAGDDSLTGTDQRGRPRLSGAHVDIGAFEFQMPSPQNPGVRRLTNGTSQFSFTSFSDTTFSVLTATNVSLPSTQWVNLGPATLITNGFYEFTESIAASNRHRFFQLRWP